MGGKAIIFSAPSGSGKTTIVSNLIEQLPTLKFSVSATTRIKRPNEVDAKDYYFLSVEQFKEKVSKEEFLEWEEVYENIYYGTLKEEVERIWSEDNTVIFDVDVQGGVKLKEKLGQQALSIFVRVPNLEVLEERLKSRSTENEDSLEMRIQKASKEMLEERKFDCVVINEVLENAVSDAFQLVRDFIEK